LFEVKPICYKMSLFKKEKYLPELRQNCFSNNCSFGIDTKMDEKLVIYEPDNSLKKGYFQLFSEIYDEVKKNRWLIYQLFKRDFLSNYRQSFLGVLWAFIIPLVSLVSFLVLNQSGLFNIGYINVPYALYALFGLAFYQLFSTGIIAGSSSLISAGSMIAKINFSKKALVISSMGKTLVAFLIQMILAFAVLAYFVIFQGFFPSTGIFLIPIFMIPIFLLTLGLSFIISVLNSVFRDIGNLLALVMTFLLFLTPVMYAVPTTGLLSILTLYNPLYYLVAVPRDLALVGATTLWVGYLASVVLSILSFILCLITFHLTETRLAERI
jgi:lipopolysaccharide transport system permease protein